MRKKRPRRDRDFDRRLWHRFWKIARPYWFGDERWVGRGLVALLVVLLVGRTELTVLFNQPSTVTIADGRLTLSQGSAAEKATRINYVEVSKP